MRFQTLSCYVRFVVDLPFLSVASFRASGNDH
ncbi:hypothetical protein vBAbaPP1_32 [Acinetobacter phage vB_AbaM_P1]